MTEKIAIYLPTSGRPTSSEETRVILAVANGLKARGESVRLIDEHEFRMPSPVAVMFGWGKLRHREILRQQALVRGKTLVVSFGALRRSEGFFTLGWNGLNGRAEYLNENSPADRWEQLKIDLRPWRSSGRHIIISGQVPTDGSVSTVDILQWCEEQTINLRCWTDRPLIFRPHPQARDISFEIPWTVRSEKLLSEDLAEAWAVVTYNSTSSSMAVIEGVPVFTADRGSMAWEVSDHDLKRIENPTLFDRTQWAFNLAYTQWQLEEIESGAAWDHLKGGIL